MELAFLQILAMWSPHVRSREKLSCNVLYLPIVGHMLQDRAVESVVEVRLLYAEDVTL